MNFKLFRLVTGCIAILSLFIGAASAQIYTESTTSAGGQNRSSQSYYMPGMFKFVQDDGSTVIMRFDREYWIGADGRKKEFWQMTFAELETKMKNMGAQMDAAMQQMQKKLESLPPEQRKKIEQAMGSQLGAKSSGGPIEVKKGGASRTIAGLSCTRFTVTESGKEVLLLWTARDVPEFAAMRKDYERFSRSMAAMRPASGADTQTRAWTEAMKVIDGFPMETEAAGSKTTVTKLERKPTPASEFEAPAGYKKVPPPF
jgi:hypothetical protein